MPRKKLRKVDSEAAAAAPHSRALVLALVGPAIAVLTTFLWRRLRAPVWRSPTGALAGFEDAGARCGIAIVHASNFSRARFEREFQEQQVSLEKQARQICVSSLRSIEGISAFRGALLYL